MAEKGDWITVVGRLGKDPELKTTKKGNDYCRFSIAIEAWGCKSNSKHLQWNSVMAFGSLGNYIHQHFHKGDEIVVNGSATTNTYQNKAGATVSEPSIIAKRVSLLDWQEFKEGERVQQPKQPEEEYDDKDLPF